MKKGRTSFFLILIIFLTAFFLRVILTSYINKGDILAINEWSKSLYKEGLKGSYFKEGWIFTPPTQPPVMMILYWVSRWFYENKYVLAVSHNLIKFPPAFVLMWIEENGPLLSVRIWGILADCLMSLLVYNLLKKYTQNNKLSFWAMVFLLFSPLTIFVSSVWGQTCMVSLFFALLSLVFWEGKFKRIFSPLFFLIGVLIKPTILVILPLYAFMVLRDLLVEEKSRKEKILALTAGVILSIIITFISFVPFWDKSKPFFEYTSSIVSRRIIPSSKGVTKVSTSAFSFYPIFYEIDKTMGTHRLGFFNLNQLGNFIFILINAFGLLLIFKGKKSEKDNFVNLVFIAYLIAEGTFLFKTGMAERYFMPAFIFSYLLFFLINDKKIKIFTVVQMFIWFVNLVVSFFLRDYSFLDLMFRHNLFIGTRLFSLLNVVIYFAIVFRLLKLRYPTVINNFKL